MMKDIREVLFEQYSDEVENGLPTKTDSALNMALRMLDDKTLDIVLDAVADVINEQMKNAFMAGFTSGVGACRMAYAVAV